MLLIIHTLEESVECLTIKSASSFYMSIVSPQTTYNHVDGA